MKLVSFILSIVVFYTTTLFAESQPKFKIGISLPLTGALSMHGNPIKNAMILAKENYDTNNQIQLIFEDDEFLAKNTTSAVKKLINADGASLIIVFGINQGLAVADIIEKAGIIFLSISVNRKVIENRKNAFLISPELTELTNLNILEAKRRNYQSIFAVSTIQDSCLLQREIFSAALKDRVVGTLDLLPSDTYLNDSAVRIKNKNVQAVFLSTLPPQGAILARRLKEIGFKGEIFSGIQEATLTELKVSDGALINSWTISNDDRNAGKFYQNYKLRFKEDARDFTTVAPRGYDAVKMILEGLKAGNISEYLIHLKNFEGAEGLLNADGKNGFSYPIALKRFTRSGLEFIQ